MPTIDDTTAFIKVAHAGQTDKGGHPYWQHPVSVMRRLPADATDAERHAALLHDVLEDTPFSAADLAQRGYDDAVIEMVRLLSRPEGLAYIDWIRSLAASGNRGAIRVKIADNEDNSDPVRIAQLPLAERDIVKRYERSLAILRPVVGQ